MNGLGELNNLPVVRSSPELLVGSFPVRLDLVVRYQPRTVPHEPGYQLVLRIHPHMVRLLDSAA